MTTPAASCATCWPRPCGDPPYRSACKRTATTDESAVATPDDDVVLSVTHGEPEPTPAVQGGTFVQFAPPAANVLVGITTAREALLVLEQVLDALDLDLTDELSIRSEDAIANLRGAIEDDRLSDDRALADRARGFVVWARRVPCRECHAVAQEHCVGSIGIVDPHPGRIAASVLAGLRTLAEKQ